MSVKSPRPHTDILVECRIPTFKRTDLLSRAIRSLRGQTCTNWRAVVLDDSPGREARAVAGSFGDERITYRPNPENLGAAANLDQAFSPQPLLGGSHAFVLEDDNALESRFIEIGLRRLEAAEVDILSFNQRCIDISESGAETAGGLLRESAREELWDRERLLLNAFLGIGLPNGGYFWTLGVPGLDLTVGAVVTEPQFQESVRQLKVPSPILLCPEALSLWSMLPSSQIRRQIVGNRRLSANLNQLSCAIVSCVGLVELTRLANRHLEGDLAGRFARNLSDLGLLCAACRPRIHFNPLGALRTAVRYFLYRDRLHGKLDAIVFRHD